MIMEWSSTKEEAEKFITRCLQLLNTHPYVSVAIIGSVINLEGGYYKEAKFSDDGLEIKKY